MLYMDKKLLPILSIIIIIFLFFLTSYFVQKNIDTVSYYMGGISGVFVYIIIVIIAEVVAPVSAIPLLPIASNSWGWFLAAIFSIIGWLIGAIIAFEISRKYGVPLVKKLVSLEQIYKIEKRIPSEHVFWSVVFLRMAIPVDILSYALGLFSNIKRKEYIFATLIGITPFAFILSYVGSLSVLYQLIAFFIGAVILILGVIGYKIRKKITKPSV